MILGQGLQIFAGWPLEIGTHPLLEIRRLAHIEKLSPFVFEKINARLGREGIDFLNQRIHYYF